MTRPTWTQYFTDLAELVAKRSTCNRRHVGAILVKNNQVISTGYNGATKGSPHCSIKGSCIREEQQIPSGERYELCEAVHAEQNAIIQCAVNGVSCKGADLYVTDEPCAICSKIIKNAEIKNTFVKGILYEY